MKRIIFYMLCLCVLFTPLAVSAGAPEEEIGDLAHEIVVTVNQQSFLELKEAITVSTLDLSGAFKIFVDTNIFEVPSNKISDIQKALDDGDYIWMFPIHAENKSIFVSIAKGPPLREDVKHILTYEQQQQVIAEEGKMGD